MPLCTVIVNRSGLGPLTLRDGTYVNTNLMLPEYFWIAVTLISVAGAVVLVRQNHFPCCRSSATEVVSVPARLG